MGPEPKAYDQLKHRIEAFLTLPFDELDEATLRTELARIGQLP